MRFEVHADHSSTHPVITLKDTVNNCSCEVYAFGGLLNMFSIPVKGNVLNVIDGYTSPEDAIKNITKGFKSAKLSPFVCRLNKGKYSFNDTNYQIEKFFLYLN